MALVNLQATKSSHEQKLQQRKTSLASQQAESEECKKNPPKDWEERARCADLKSKIWDDKGAIIDLQGTLEDITSKIADLQPKVEQSQAWLEEKNNQYQAAMTDLQNDLDRLETQRDSLYRKVSQLTKDSAKTAGATMSVVFLSKHQDLIRQFQELNKDLNVSFVPMPIKASLLTVSSTRKGIDGSQSESNSIVLESQISGLKTRNEFDESIPEVSLINGGETSSSILFGQAAGGKMVINRLAACEIQRKIKNQDDPVQAATAISNLFAPTVTYKYEMQVGASIRYRYREDHLYQLIRKHTQSNGLFRTRSSQSLLESGQYNKWIEIEITSQDSEHHFDNPLSIAENIRARKLDEALMRVASSYSQGITPPALGEAPRSGASKLIEEGNRCSFLFCRYSTLTLKIGDALFGGQTAESEMQRSVKASSTETIDIKDMVSEIGTMSLTSKSN
jgi:hypothetical protein